MDHSEARSVLTQEVRAYRERELSDLKALLQDVESHEVVGPSGAVYQVEVQAVWDDEPGGNLRVLISLDDGGLRAFAPLSDGFIVSPSGAFVGE